MLVNQNDSLCRLVYKSSYGLYLKQTVCLYYDLYEMPC